VTALIAAGEQLAEAALSGKRRRVQCNLCGTSLRGLAVQVVPKIEFIGASGIAVDVWFRCPRCAEVTS